MIATSSKKRFKNFILQYWAYILFSSALTATLIKGVINSLGGNHSPDFDIFIASAQKLLSAENPYGINYPSGQFLYSPSSGIFFYSIFTLFPYSISSILYSAILIGVFIYALKKLLLSSSDLKLNNLFLLLILPEVIGSLLNTKFELIVVAALLLILADTQLPPNKIKNSFLAIVSNFKLQALAPAGLIFVTLLKKPSKAKSYVFTFLIASIAIVLLPSIFFGNHFNLKMHESWILESKNFIAQTQSSRTNIWNFMGSTFNLNFSDIVLSLSNLFIAGFLAIWCFILKDRASNPYLRPIALGSAYSIVFSPAAQSSAFVLLVPLFWAMLQIRSSLKSTRQLVTWKSSIFLSYFLISIIYSDLVPKFLRLIAREYSIKAFGGLILILAYLYLDLKATKKT